MKTIVLFVNNEIEVVKVQAKSDIENHIQELFNSQVIKDLAIEKFTLDSIQKDPNIYYSDSQKVTDKGLEVSLICSGHTDWFTLTYEIVEEN